MNEKGATIKTIVSFQGYKRKEAMLHTTKSAKHLEARKAVIPGLGWLWRGLFFSRRGRGLQPTQKAFRPKKTGKPWCVIA